MVFSIPETLVNYYEEEQKMKGLLIGVSLLSVAVVGCAATHKPTPERISSANYGIYAENHRPIVEDYMKKILFDPNSAVYDDWRGPIKGYFSDKTGSYFGYRVCVEINSKNRTGRYVGSQRFYFLL